MNYLEIVRSFRKTPAKERSLRSNSLQQKLNALNVINLLSLHIKWYILKFHYTIINHFLRKYWLFLRAHVHFSNRVNHLFMRLLLALPKERMRSSVTSGLSSRSVLKMAEQKSVPSDLYKSVYSFLLENKFTKAAQLFMKQTKVVSILLRVVARLLVVAVCSELCTSRFKERGGSRQSSTCNFTGCALASSCQLLLN